MTALEFTAWTTAIIGTIGVLIAFVRPALRYWKARKDAGQSVDILGVALAFAEGYDAAKSQITPEAKAAVSNALKAATERAGVTEDTAKFLARFNFNRPAQP